MKTLSYPAGISAACLATILALAAPAFAPAALAQVRPAQSRQPNFDKRSQNPRVPQDVAARQNAYARLKAQLPAAAVDFDALLGSPKFVRDPQGFLTGPNGEGKAVSAQAARAIPAADPYRPIKAFLNEHSALYGHGAEALDSARVKRDYVDAHNGLHTVVWEQQLDGIPVYQAVLMGHITKKGELTSLSSLFVPNLAAGADAGTPGRSALQAAPPISPTRALLLAAQNLEFSLAENQIVPAGGPAGEGNYLLFKTPEIAFARMVWLPLSRFALRLSWEVILTKPDTHEMFRLVLDAQTGEVQLRESLSSHISDATYTVYPSDSPSPFSPGWPTPNTAQPPLTTRTSITTPALDTIASPEGWIPDGSNTTTGNNADVFVDRDWDGQPDRPRPQGNPDRVFDFPLDLTQDPTNYIDASIVQLFWRINWYHDRLYQLGFTEAAGNFQDNNFGRGGQGNDHVIGYIQAGADLGVANNAMFGTPPDGFSGRCYMFIMNFPRPNRDSALDSEVVCHELTHGTSWRLVGGGMVLGSLQGNGMGEGWGDFYSLNLLSEPADDPNGVYASGAYFGYQFFGLNQNYYFGDRHYPYCTDMSKNPFTFKDIDPAQVSPHAGVPRSPLFPFYPPESSEVHFQGEVWCSILWEVRANLIAKYGYAGNELMLQLATDGMKLTPGAPNFIQARDAILLADRIDNAGANQGEIWRGFAKRGLGLSASSPDGSTTSGVVEAFDIPGLQIDHTLVLGGNANGVIDPNECTDLQIFLLNSTGGGVTNVSAFLSTTTPAVIIVQNASTYDDFPVGATNANLAFFKISTRPDFVCGTPIDLNLLIKAGGLNTTTNSFRLLTGLPGVPLRFDSTNAPLPIPDGSAAGVYSSVLVSNIPIALNKVTVSLYLTHTYDSDLTLQLISPDGTTNTLSRNNGGSGDNFGSSCSPDSNRTTFDDASPTPISAGNPPWLGSFRPDQPLSIFTGKSGTNVNGTWRLHIIDSLTPDAGILECWSLTLTPATCTDGGGECLGSDLAIGMTATPDPVLASNYIVFSISVTNNGPKSAKTVNVSQVLPAGFVFVSGSSSQGTVSSSAGLVTCKLGSMLASRTATISIAACPTIPGTFATTATVSSEQPDFIPANNAATVTSHVIPRAADLAVGIAAAPPSPLAGDVFTYTVTVTNNGPSTANNVVVSNLLPVSVSILSVSPSQGSSSTFGSAVLCSFGTLLPNTRATATIQVRSSAEGLLTALATAAAAENDPLRANNFASVSIAIGPASDLVLTGIESPDPVLKQGRLTYSLTISNQGPSTASAVTLIGLLPPALTVNSNYATQGSVSVSDSGVSADLGSLARGASASVYLYTTPAAYSSNYTVLASFTASASQADTNIANNSLTLSTYVAAPFVSIVPDSALLLSESFSPTNGAIDIGETVSLRLFLRNVGNCGTTNLVATLLQTNGVVPIPPLSRSYDTIFPGDKSDAPFTFTATGTVNGSIVAWLHLQDNGGYSTNVSFVFPLPHVTVCSNTNQIIIPDSGPATNYPSVINVAGVTGQVSKVTATLLGFTHTYPHDVSALLVSPSGTKTLLMAHAGGGFTPPYSVSDIDLTFDDTAASPLPASTRLTAGTWRPAAYDAPAAFPSNAPAGPYPVSFSAFNGVDPTGPWSLYVYDDTVGDQGQIARGWSLSFTTVFPVNPPADLGLSVVAAPGAVRVGDSLVYTFTITNVGPADAASVLFSDALPAAVKLLSVSSSALADTSTNGQLVTGTIPLLPAGTNATITITVSPTVAASLDGITTYLTNSAAVYSSAPDLHTADNSASAVVAINPQPADVALGLSAPATIVVGSNFNFVVSVTNLGLGTAFNVMLTNPLPPALQLIQNGFLAGTNLVCSFAAIPAGASASTNLVLYANSLGTITNASAISLPGAQLDPNTANNSAALTLSLVPPSINLALAGVHLTSESFSPPNGVVDPGETVTVEFSLQNFGTVPSGPITATLLPTGGVVPLSSARFYGVLTNNPVAKPFSFSASHLNGEALVATLQLQDGSGIVTNLTYSFALNRSFASTDSITIASYGAAAPYPSVITVSNLEGLVSKVTVSLVGLTHSFPSDVNALLVSPSGLNVLLMSHAGGAYSLTSPITLNFDDSAPAALPNGAPLSAGTYRPSQYGTTPAFIAPAPTAPYGLTLAALNSAQANGDWKLYILDDFVGDGGAIAAGWTLNITTVNVVGSVADVAVAVSANPPSLYQSGTIAYTITVTNLGPGSVSDLVLSDPLPANLTALSGSTSWGSNSLSGNTLTWYLGPLSPGAGATITLTAAPARDGIFVNTATVQGNFIDLNPANNSASASAVVYKEAQLSGAAVRAGQFYLDIIAHPGTTYAIQASTNLTTWSWVSTNVVPATGILNFSDPATAKARFYRVVRLTP